MSEKEYIENPEDIQLNENRELQQILGNPPGNLLRFGNSFILVGFVVFIALGWLIKYPDVIPAKVVLTSQLPPIRVFAETSGKISELRFPDQAKVEKGQIIAVLDNPAKLEDIAKLDTFLNQIQNDFSNSELSKIEIPRNLKLGNLQSTFADFTKSLDQHLFYLQTNNAYLRIQNLENQIKKLENLRTSLGNQIITQQKIEAISLRDFERNDTLIKIGGISETELEASEAAYYRNKRQLEILEDAIINNDLLIGKTRMEIIETRQEFVDSKGSGRFSIQEEVQNIQGELEDWKQSYLIKAPISGNISFTKFRSAQQFINQNEEFLTIVPEAVSTIIAKGVLPPRGSGKVEKGMRANVRLEGYSYQEFGSVKCEVNRISLVPQGEGFLVELSVPQPMQTTYNKIIPFQQEMQGTANIITEDRRILERIFDKVLSIVFN